MPVKILITRESDASWSQEREFNQEVITIGRESNSVLLLDDPKKVVSRRHAELKLEAGSYQLVDCGSHNFTYLNSKRIARNIPYRLESGDSFKIGDYIMKFLGVVVEAEEPQRDETVVLVNPFHEEMRIFEGLLKKLQRNYSGLDENGRRDQLRFALQGMLMDVGGNEATAIVGEELAGKKAPDRRKLYENLTDVEGDSSASVAPKPGEPAPSHLSEILNILLKPFITVSKATHEFRRNFMGAGQTNGQSGLGNMSEDELKSFLLGEDIPAGAIEKRLAVIQHRIEEMVKYQNAAYDLYNIELNEGTLEILEELNPDRLTQVYGQQIKLPFRLQNKVNSIIRERIMELINAKGGVFKTENFSSLFVNKYLKRSINNTQK